MLPLLSFSPLRFGHTSIFHVHTRRNFNSILILEYLANFSCWKYMGYGWRVGRWVGDFIKILPLSCAILQAGSSKIFSFAENPNWSRMWQFYFFYLKKSFFKHCWNALIKPKLTQHFFSLLDCHGQTPDCSDLNWMLGSK